MIILSHKYMPICGYGFAAVGLLLAFGAAAEPNGPPPPPDRPGAEHAPAVGERPAPPLPGAMVEAHLAFMKTALKLTDAQLPTWNGVADVLREQAKRRDAEITALRASDKTATQLPDLPTVLQDRQHMIVEEGEDLSKLLIALKPFYVMLSAEQKEIAGHLFLPPHGKAGMPGIREGGPMPMRPDGPPPECQPLFSHEAR